jgi:hypothetical protein
MITQYYTPVNRSVRSYLPVNLDISEHVFDKWVDYAAFFAGGLYLRHHTDKHCELGDFHPWSSHRIKNVLPERDYRKIIDCLVLSKVIEENGSYRTSRPGLRGHPKSYRLSPRYTEEKFRSAILTHPELVRKVHAQRAADAGLCQTPVQQYLREWLHKVELVEDWPKVSLPLRLIADKEFRATPCRAGRFHTNITNLSSNLREFLRIDGERLHAIDIVGSQPLLLGLSLTRKGRDKGWREGRVPSVSTYGTFSDECCNDIERYVEVCLDGRIYEALMAITGYDRLTQKHKFFETIYGSLPWNAKTITAQALASLFPGVLSAIVEINDGTTLALQMQTAESDIVINRVCERLRLEMPSAPALTLHDSLITTESNLDAFQSILKEEFKAVYEVEPKLTRKLFKGQD